MDGWIDGWEDGLKRRQIYEWIERNEKMERWKDERLGTEKISEERCDHFLLGFPLRRDGVFRRGGREREGGDE